MHLTRSWWAWQNRKSKIIWKRLQACCKCRKSKIISVVIMVLKIALQCIRVHCSIILVIHLQKIPFTILFERWSYGVKWRYPRNTNADKDGQLTKIFEFKKKHKEQTSFALNSVHKNKLLKVFLVNKNEVFKKQKMRNGMKKSCLIACWKETVSEGQNVSLVVCYVTTMPWQNKYCMNFLYA